MELAAYNACSAADAVAVAAAEAAATAAAKGLSAVYAVTAISSPLESPTRAVAAAAPPPAPPPGTQYRDENDGPAAPDDERRLLRLLRPWDAATPGLDVQRYTLLHAALLEPAQALRAPSASSTTAFFDNFYAAWKRPAAAAARSNEKRVKTSATATATATTISCVSSTGRRMLLRPQQHSLLNVPAATTAMAATAGTPAASAAPAATQEGDVGGMAVWFVSSALPGYGVSQLRHASTDSFWQSDAVGPHSITLRFARQVSLTRLSIFADITLDGSYTPRFVCVRYGPSQSHLESLDPVELRSPIGWIDLPLSASGRAVACHVVQLLILSNQRQGKDTHLRGLRAIGYPTSEPVPVAVATGTTSGTSASASLLSSLPLSNGATRRALWAPRYLMSLFDEQRQSGGSPTHRKLHIRRMF